MASAGTDFSFARLPTHLPVERGGRGVWRAMMTDSVIHVMVESLPGAAFYGDVLVGSTPGLRVTFGESSASLLARNREHLLSDGNDDVFLAVNLGGQVICGRTGREVELEAGQALLMPVDDPFTITRLSAGPGLNLRVPRAALAPLVPKLDDAIGQPFDRDSTPLRLLTGYVRSLTAERAVTTPELRHAIVAHVHDLIALTVGAKGDGAGHARDRGVAAARLQTLKDDIVANLADPDLSASALAARHRMTPRHLHRLFEGEGATFSGFVLGHRLARAHRMLADPRFAARNIATIAFDSGFSDVSYFNRVFRRLYGVTPSEARAQAHFARAAA